MSRSKEIVIVLLAVTLCLGLADVARAAVITFDSCELTGQGFGNAPPILTVQPQGSATTECGAVWWNGSDDMISDDASPGKCQTITAGSVLNQGITRDNLGLLFNINEPLSDADMNLNVFKFSVDFYWPSGDSILSAEFDAGSGGLTLYNFDIGQGKAGWLFRIELRQDEFDSVFGDVDNRIGMTIPSANPITDVADGAEDFRMYALPEPATVALLGLGLLVRLRRCRN